MARRRITTEDLAQQMCRAHSDLNGFYAVIALMENGLMTTDSHADQIAIIERCKSAAQKCLRRHDVAREKLRMALGDR